MKCTAFEDNSGALHMAKFHKMRPRTKHINQVYHHFRSHVRDGKISIHAISTTDQIADIFTKPLDQNSFVRLRRKYLHWWFKKTHTHTHTTHMIHSKSRECKENRLFPKIEFSWMINFSENHVAPCWQLQVQHCQWWHHTDTIDDWECSLFYFYIHLIYNFSFTRSLYCTT